MIGRSVGQNYIPNIIPPSPEASKLANFVEVPVSYYTGTPNINIPITNVKSGALQLPISLTYNASGNRVEDIASWVGLGWTLNAGGVVTRVVRGLPDDHKANSSLNFFQVSESNTNMYNFLQSATLATEAFYADAARGCNDTEPDQFYFNFNGYSGKFSFDWNTVAPVSGQIVDWNKNIKVDCSKKVTVRFITASGGSPAITTTNNVITGWIITAEDGTTYKFEAIESTKVFNPTYTIPSNVGCRSTNNSHNSGWYLTEISDVNGENKIKLFYDDYVLDYGFRHTETVKHEADGSDIPYNLTNKTYPEVCGPDGLTSSTSNLITSCKRIRRITITNTLANEEMEVEFIPDTQSRTDNAGLGTQTVSFRRLSTIVVRDLSQTVLSNREVMTYVLGHDYSTGRLTLKNVYEQKAGVCKPGHTFEYDNVGMPSILSYGQDHNGFYNGKDIQYVETAGGSILSMIPPIIYTRTGLPNPIFYDGADREPNFQFAKAGIIKKIKYPTGGYSEFDFEQNEYGFIASTSVSTVVTQNMHSEVLMAGQTAGSATTPNEVTFTLDYACPELNGIQKSCVKVNYSGFNCISATANFKPYIKIINSLGATVFSNIFSANCTSTCNPAEPDNQKIVTLFLPLGTYKLQAFAKFFDPTHADCQKNDFASIAVDYKNINTITPSAIKKSITGIRVKEIRDYTSINDNFPIIREFSYKMGSNANSSSGVIYLEPKYSYLANQIVVLAIGSPTSPARYDALCSFYLRLSKNRTALGTTQGSHIGYREVSVNLGRNGIFGKTVYKYTSPYEFNDSIVDDIPFPPASSSSYKTGLLTEETVYKAGSTLPVKQTINEYYFKETFTNGIKVQLNSSQSDFPIATYYKNSSYSNNLGHTQLSKTTTKIYSTNNPTDFITSVMEYKYDRDTEFQNLSASITERSDGKKQRTEMYYPNDYTQPSPVITSMKTLNIVGTPIETVSIMMNGAVENVIGASYNTFTYTASKFRLSKINKLQTNVPFLTSAFTYSKNNALAVFDSRYSTIPEAQFLTYDNNGNITSYKERNGITTNLSWYSTFGKSNLLSSKTTGIGGSIPQTTAYDYYPLIGLKTVTDPNLFVSTYNYDGLNRLKDVRDLKNNILKSFAYNYADNCNTVTPPSPTIGCSVIATVIPESFVDNGTPTVKLTGSFDGNSAAVGDLFSWFKIGINNPLSLDPTLSVQNTNVGDFIFKVTRGSQTACVKMSITASANGPTVTLEQVNP